MRHTRAFEGDNHLENLPLSVAMIEYRPRSLGGIVGASIATAIAVPWDAKDFVSRGGRGRVLFIKIMGYSDMSSYERL